MDSSTVIWIIVAIVVVVLVVALVMRATRARRLENHRAEAQELRETAAAHDRAMRERMAGAEQAEARARAARAEADKLEAQAERHREGATAVRNERDEQLRRADARDPDVETAEDDYRTERDTRPNA
jgi:biopolymer transport protein ExbB/TolQ